MEALLDLYSTKHMLRPHVILLIARLRNHNATDNDNIDFRSFKTKFYIQNFERVCKVVDLLVQKLSNEMILD